MGFDITRLAEYNCMDSAGTKQIEEVLWKELNDTDYREVYDFYVELHKPLMYMMTRGILVNKDNLNIVLEEVTIRREAAQAKLDEICGHELNVDSPKQCIQYFYIEKGIAPYFNPKTKAPTCDDIALRRLAKGTVSRKPIPEANLVQEIRGRGLMIGIELDLDVNHLKTAALDQGLLLNITQNKVIRLLPPLIIDEAQADQIVDTVCKLIDSLE